MPIDNHPLDANHNFDDQINGQARETRSGSDGSHDSLLGGGAYGSGGDGSSPSLFGSSLGSSRSFGSGRFIHQPPPNTAIKRNQPSLPHPEADFPELGFQPLFQDQMTKLRSSTNQPSPIIEHTPQLVAPQSNGAGNHHINGSVANGASNGSVGVNGIISSSSYEPSSDESSGYAGRSRSPSLLSNLCQEFAAAAGTAPPPTANYGGSGRGPADGHRLLDLTNRTGYPIVQRNGQRIYGPPPNWGAREQPSKGCEVFVGRVPRDIFEPELVPVFEKVGIIYELRLMMDFSGSNRGFFFVRYTCKEDAKRACKELDNFEIRPHKRLGVLMSLDNNKLWLSGIPNGATQEDIKTEIEALTEGVCKVILYPSPNDRTRPRKYAFVEYENHRAAALARRRLVPTKIIINGHEIEKVDWAEPQNEVDEEIMSTVKVLFVRNLTEKTSEQYLVHLFNQWCSGQVERVKKAKDYAFVHFYNRAAAEMAKMYSANQVIDGEVIEVEWSKPVDKTIYNTRKALTKLFSQPAPMPMAPNMHRMFGDPLTHHYGGGYPIYNNGCVAGDGMMRGAPGTLPPRNLIKKLTGGQLPIPGYHPHHEPANLCTKGFGGWAGSGAPASAGFCAGDVDPAITKALNDLKLASPSTSASPGLLGSFPGLTGATNGPAANGGSPPAVDHGFYQGHQPAHPFAGVFGTGHPHPAQMNNTYHMGHHPAAAVAAAAMNPFALNQWLAAAGQDLYPVAAPAPQHQSAAKVTYSFATAEENGDVVNQQTATVAE